MNPAPIITTYAIRRQVTEAANTLPVSVGDVMDFLRLTAANQETPVENMIKAAVAELEQYCWRQFMECEMDAYYPIPEAVKNGIWSGTYLRLELNGCPIQSVDNVKYYDQNGTLQTMSASDYVVEMDLEPAIITITNVPTFDYNRAAPLIVHFYGGWTSAALVPDPIKHAIMIRVGTLYEMRQEVNIGSSVNEIPMTVKRLLTNYRLNKPQ